jgi:hypothetical protein
LCLRARKIKIMKITFKLVNQNKLKWTKIICQKLILSKLIIKPREYVKMR